MKNTILKHSVVSIKFVFLLLILLVMSCKSSIRENEVDLKKVSVEFMKQNRNVIDGYLIDMLANDHFYGDSIYTINDSQVVYYYQAHEYIQKYDSKLVGTLEPAIEFIDLAIRKDSYNSFNYFLKSYLLFKNGALTDAKTQFRKGLSANKMCSYQEEASFALLSVADFKGPLNEVQSLSLTTLINKLSTNTNYLVYIGRNIRSFLTDQNVNITDKQRVFNMLCEYANQKDSFELISYSNIVMYNRLVQLTHDNIIKGNCNNKSSYHTIYPGIEFKEMVEEYYRKHDIEIISKSRFWSNLCAIRKEMKNRKEK